MFSYKTFGNPNLPKLIFFHGFMGSCDDFIPLACHLQNSFHCILINLYDRSLPNSTTEYLKNLVNNLKGLVDQDTGFCGYSLGGRITLKIQQYLNCKYLVLISSSVGLETEEQIKGKIKQEEKWLDELENTSFSDFLKNWYRLPLFFSLERNFKGYPQMLKRRELQDPVLVKQALRLFSVKQIGDLKPNFESLEGPLLYMCGREDKKYYAMSKKLQREKPTAWVGVISNCSHAVHLEDPLSISSTIKSFYRSYYG